MNAIGTQLRDRLTRDGTTEPNKLGTDPMTYGGLNKKMAAAAELARNPVSKHQIQPGYGDEQADAGRDTAEAAS